MQPLPDYELPRDGNHVPVAGGQYNSTPPTITDGDLRALQLDSSGNLKVNVEAGGGGGGNVNLTEVGGSSYALGSTTSANSLPVTIASDNTGPVEITDGTNKANVVAGDTGYNGLATASATKTYTFTTSASGAQTILANTNVEGYSWIEIVYTSVGSGLALTGQWSPNSGGTYINSTTWGNTSGTNTNTALGAAINTIYHSNMYANFFQLNVTALTSGTFSGYVILHDKPRIASQQGVVATQTGSWAVAPAASATGGYTYAHVAAGQATTVIKAAAGTLHSITFGGAATATNTTTLYDNATGSGTVIGIPSVTALVAPTTLLYDIAFTTGLTIITATANGADMTVAFK